MQSPEQTEYYSHLPLPEKLEPAPLGPNNPPWGPLEASGLWVMSVALILFVPLIFLAPYLAASGRGMENQDEVLQFLKSDPTAVFLQILAIVPAHLLTIGLAWLIVTRGNKFPFRTMLGWQRGGFRWWHYCMILGLFIVIAQLVTMVWPEQENELIRLLQTSRSAVYIVAFVATFTAPFAEELVYRGVLYSALQKWFGLRAGFLSVTILFTLVHVLQYYPSYSTIFLLFLLSLTLTAIRVKTGNLFPCIVLHTLFNGLQSLLLIIEPYINKEEVKEQAVAIILALLRWPAI